jgi:hypothetical protein
MAKMNKPELVKELGRIFLKPTHKQKTRAALYKCACGEEFVGEPRFVDSGKTKSCGCSRFGNIRTTECIVDGCDSKPRSPLAEYCEVHYYRLRRNGKLELLNKYEYKKCEFIRRKVSIDNAGYFNEGGERSHRRIAREFYGDKMHKCHWCGIDIHFKDCHVDHVDECKTNNSINNLVISCPRCNITRGTYSKNLEKYGIEFNGERKLISEWAEVTTIKSGTISWRLSNGWSVEKTLTTDPKEYHNK